MEQHQLRTVNRNPKTWRNGKVMFSRVTSSIEPSEIVRGNVYVYVSKPLPTVEEWLEANKKQDGDTSEGDKGMWMC